MNHSKIKLRDYQIESVRQVRRAFQSGLRKPFVVLATGAGKTTIAIDIIRRSVNNGTRVLVTAHRREIIQQFHERLQTQAGIEAGLILSGVREDRSKMVQVASRQTLHNRKYPPAGLVIVDEAHLIRGSQYEEMLSHYSDSFMIFLTATPERLDRKPLKEFSDGIINPVKMSWLIEQGYLCDHRLFQPKGVNLTGIRLVAGEYNQRMLHERFDQEPVYEAIHEVWKELRQGVTIGFCVNIEHSEQLADYFRRKGVKAVAIHSKVKNRRDEIVQAVKNGEYEVVFNPNILTEGFDAPILKTCMLCMATQSTVKFMQACGRVMRPYNQQNATIIDFGGNIRRLGAPRYYDAKGFSLDAEQRSTNQPPPTKTCPDCALVVAPNVRICPNCGYEWETAGADQDGELANKLTWEQVDEIKELVHQYRNLEYRDIYNVPPHMLRVLAAVRGYRPQWVIHMLVARGLLHGYPDQKATIKKGWNVIKKLEADNNVQPILDTVKAKMNGVSSPLLDEI